jgi:hypothetical protein
VASWQRDQQVAARADAILAGARTADAYAGHFEAQLRAARFRAWCCHGLLTVLRIVGRPVLVLAGRTREPARESPGRDRKKKRRS